MWDKKYESCKTVKELQTVLGLHSKAATLEWARNNVPLESHFQKKIIAYLRREFPRAVVWKQANGLYSSLNGLPDVAMVKDGQYFAFEVKRPFIGKPTAIQKGTIARLRNAGAVAHIVCYVSEVAQIIKDYDNPSQGKKQ